MFWDFGQLLQGLFAAFAILAAFARVFSQLLQEGGGGQRGRRAEGGGGGCGGDCAATCAQRGGLARERPQQVGGELPSCFRIFLSFCKFFFQGFLARFSFEPKALPKGHDLPENPKKVGASWPSSSLSLISSLLHSHTV